MSFTVTFSYVCIMYYEANSLTLSSLASQKISLHFHKQFPSTICLLFLPRVYI